MDINSVWAERLRQFYIKMIKYFSIIAMGVFYSFLIFGSVFVYYYIKLLQWLPQSISTEIIASLFVTVIFLRTRVRTFVKKADIIFLMPMEANLSLYFRKSMYYSVFIDVFRLIIAIIIISPLIKNKDLINIPFLLIFLGLIILNIRLTWVEQWLQNMLQKIVHKLNRFISFFTILYFMFIENWTIVVGLMVINYILLFYLFGKRKRGVNWEYLISQEEKSLLKIYKFINIYIDVPQLKRSFGRRKILGWMIKKIITHKQSSSHIYLFSHLFVRYNDFYYLYIRLNLIGFSIIYFLPAYGWVVTLLILYMTGYQILPLQHSISDSFRLYPVSSITIKRSFKKLIMTLLILQLIFLNSASLIHLNHIKAIFPIFIEALFIYWFVHFFVSKRIFKHLT